MTMSYMCATVRESSAWSEREPPTFPPKGQGYVHSYTGIFENIAFSIGLGFSSTRKWRFGSLKTEIFINSCQRGDFRKQFLHLPVDEEYEELVTQHQT